MPASASDSAKEWRLCLRGDRLLRSRKSMSKPKMLWNILYLFRPRMALR